MKIIPKVPFDQTFSKSLTANLFSFFNARKVVDGKERIHIILKTIYCLFSNHLSKMEKSPRPSTCIGCGEPTHAGRKYCDRCEKQGLALVNAGIDRQDNKCLGCGKLISDNRKYCGDCDTQGIGLVDAGAKDKIKEIDGGHKKGYSILDKVKFILVLAFTGWLISLNIVMTEESVMFVENANPFVIALILLILLLVFGNILAWIYDTVKFIVKKLFSLLKKD